MASDFNALVAAGYDWKSGGLTIGPLASFQYTYVEFDGFTEHGSLAPLSFSDQNAESSRTALGAKASYDWHVGHVVVKPEIRAAWQHEFGDTDYSIVIAFCKRRRQQLHCQWSGDRPGQFANRSRCCCLT